MRARISCTTSKPSSSTSPERAPGIVAAMRSTDSCKRSGIRTIWVVLGGVLLNVKTAAPGLIVWSIRNRPRRMRPVLSPRETTADPLDQRQPDAYVNVLHSVRLVKKNQPGPPHELALQNVAGDVTSPYTATQRKPGESNPVLALTSTPEGVSLLGPPRPADFQKGGARELGLAPFVLSTPQG